MQANILIAMFVFLLINSIGKVFNIESPIWLVGHDPIYDKYIMAGKAEDAKGEYTKAEESYGKAMKRAKLLNSRNAYVAFCMSVLADTYAHQKQYAKAELTGKEAIEMNETVCPKDDPMRVICLNNLGQIYAKECKYTQAENYLKRALETAEANPKIEQSTINHVLINLGTVYKRQGKFAEATAMFSQAKSQGSSEAKEGNLATFGINDASCEKNMDLAAKAAESQNYPDAERYYSAAIEAAKLTAKDDPRLESCQRALAAIYIEEKKYPQAEKVLKEVLADKEKKLGPNSLDLIGSLYDLSNLYAEEGKQAEVKKIEQRCNAITTQTSKALEPTPARPEPSAKEKQTYSTYLAIMQKQLKANWHPPKMKMSKHVTITFKVWSDGHVTDTKIFKSSGSVIFDKQALYTIHNSKLPALPKGSPPYVDIQFTFDYNCLNIPKGLRAA